MLKPRTSQGSFLDVDMVCERLIPPESFYRKFWEVVAPPIRDAMWHEEFSDSLMECVAPLECLPIYG